MTVAVQKRPDTIPDTHKWMQGFFKGDDVFIVGGGPSLTGFDFRKLDRKRVIAINWAFRDCSPDVLVFLDSSFYREVTAMGYNFASAPFRVVTQAKPGKAAGPNTTIIHPIMQPSKNPMKLMGGASSAFTAINLAIIGGAKRIILLGIDGGFLGGKKGHYYSGTGGKFILDAKKKITGYEGDGSFTPSSDNKELNFKRMIPGFQKFVGMAEIINCSLQSEIKCFPKIAFDEIIKEVN